MGFWERTWQERTEAIKLAYGETSPPDYVVSFSWNEPRCPGACTLCLPPISASRDPIRHRRDDWLYLTMGLSQPLDRQQVDRERAAGKSYSAFGIEFAFVVPEQADWPAQALYYFMTYMTEGEEIGWGDRFPFGFHTQTDGKVAVCTGNRRHWGVEPLGDIRAVLFWPFLFPDSHFLTTTGKFMVMVATGISEREWELAKQTTTAHVLLLLCRSGIVQRTYPQRQCLLKNPRWREEWAAIAAMSPEECEKEIDAGIGRWHLATPDANQLVQP